MTYNKLVKRYFFAPQHVGMLDLAKPLTVYYRVGEKTHGQVSDFYMQCQKNGLINRMCFKAYGNPYWLAAAEWLCQQLEGHKVNNLKPISHLLLIEQLAIPATRYPLALQIADTYQELLNRMTILLKRNNHE